MGEKTKAAFSDGRIVLRIETLRTKRHSVWKGRDEWAESWEVEAVVWIDRVLPLRTVVDVVGAGKSYEAALSDLAGEFFQLGFDAGFELRLPAEAVPIADRQ
jgi:hypothetical protein